MLELNASILLGSHYESSIRLIFPNSRINEALTTRQFTKQSSTQTKYLEKKNHE